MQLSATPASAAQILPLREDYRREMDCQIIHDSMHRRLGWTKSWILGAGDRAIGFGSLALAGPWTNRPTLFEFYVVPDDRRRVFAVFEVLLTASGARFIETQSNGALLAIMLHAWASHTTSEKILFRDAHTTALPSCGASLRRVSSAEDDRACFERRDGSSDWEIDLDGVVVGQGGIAFHYNAPYGDIYMEIAEPWRRRGLGAYLVQELKRICRELGGIPAARCSPDNIASRQTCQKAGFVPCGHLLTGELNRDSR